MKKKKIIKNSKVFETNNVDNDVVNKQLARVLADYDNLQKRVEREKQSLWQVLVARFTLRMLPVYDMLLDAQNHLQDAGIALTIAEFEKILQEEGIEEIGINTGDEFTEKLCEVVEVVATKDKQNVNKVAQVVVKGFKMINGDVIRPTKVKVFKN